MGLNTKSIVGLVLSGISILSGLIGSWKDLFSSTSTATPAQKADIVTDLAGTVISGVAAVSGGPQVDTMAKAAASLPQLHTITEGLMNLAETNPLAKPGADKQTFVSNVLQALVKEWEIFSEGQQKITVEDSKPILDATINNLVPVFFPKDEITEVPGSPAASKG